MISWKATEPSPEAVFPGSILRVHSRPGLDLLEWNVPPCPDRLESCPSASPKGTPLHVKRM